MMIESSRESGRQLISGIADYARHFGPWHFHWETQGLAHVDTLLEETRYDGVLMRDMAEVQAFLDVGIPVVAFAYSKRHIVDTCWVKTDDRGVGEVVANHFLQRGFRHFAFCGYDGLPWAVDRGDSFAAVLGEAGFQVDSFLIPPPVAGELDDAAIVRWLAALPCPAALMAANDDLGQKIVHLCRESGLRVPDDCAVVGVDNDPVVCGMSNPPLSSVRLDQYQSGYGAAAMLDKMMKGKAPENKIITARAGELVVRQSSDLIAVDDAAVAKALRFIQENAHRPLKVDEVARASGLYRRGLEKRFREHLAHSIQEYCRKARAEHVAKILRECRLSLEEIAAQCGFSHAPHLTRFFTSMRGETPSAYRKRVSVP
ncbi:AraC family transcriptional regulator [Pontiella sulfatireligans]|uniref:Xylose operon regulatory protein n=1 Tax=Pontiella sulfatireligans TaxID=2750658 RepID=A0A6C2UIA3_9BACT|nr:DNA-binding transcriptional regulator [Pontiella sulfatireligans]VGO19187.1 Xylose operon regulatory protein [Pontiella sulfatireligans]